MECIRMADIPEGFDGTEQMVKWKIEGYYKHAVKNGHWRYYNLDGDVEKDRYFKNGKELKGAALEAYLESIKPKPKN